MPETMTKDAASSEGAPPASQPASPETSQWNTSNLGLRLSVDLLAASSAGILVSPIVCIIDRAIVAKAAHSDPIRKTISSAALTALKAPHKFVVSKPFLLILLLYTSTYTTANAIDTLTSTVSPYKYSPSSTSAGPQKFLATSAVNMSLCVYKDSQFARMFGAPGKTSAIPRVTYALFMLRDSMTIFASFNLPPLLSPHVPRFTEALEKEANRSNVAQFVAPAGIQIFSTPVHLLGLDLYNRGEKLGWGERLARIKRDWAVSALARMGRIVPAFGFGGVVNASVRRGGMGWIGEE